MENPGAFPCGGLVFQLACHLHRYWAYSSKSTVWPKMESCFQDRACPVSAFTVAKKLPANARDEVLIPGSRRLPGEGNDNPSQYFCLENPMDKGACQATAHGVIESDMTDQMSTHRDS